MCNGHDLSVDKITIEFELNNEKYRATHQRNKYTRIRKFGERTRIKPERLNPFTNKVMEEEKIVEQGWFAPDRKDPVREAVTHYFSCIME